MQNPLKTLRTLNQLTQKEFADLANVSRQIVTNTEAGVYNSIPKSLLPIIQELDPVDYHDYARNYHEWQRQEVSKLSKQNFPDFITYFPETFTQWRSFVHPTQAGFCRLLKIQDSILTNYESGKTETMPAFLWDRLETIGFSRDYITKVANLPNRIH